jgi:hypothetical protein
MPTGHLQQHSQAAMALSFLLGQLLLHLHLHLQSSLLEPLHLHLHLQSSLLELLLLLLLQHRLPSLPK